jgi:hypothetical protein
VQPKNVMFPTDAKLLNRAREKLVRLAKLRGVALRQSYARVGKFALIQHQRYAHAKQFKRAKAHRPYELMAWTTPALSGILKSRQEKEHKPCPIRTLSRSVST